jgi:hypothetical protein
MDTWQEILSRALDRSSWGQKVADLVGDEAADRTWEWLTSELMELGEPFVADCRSAVDRDWVPEPHLSLVQLYCGCLRLMLEADQAREGMPEEVPVLLPGSVAVYAHIVQLLSDVKATLILTSRGLDVQAFTMLRQAMELSARAIVLAGDKELGSMADVMALPRELGGQEVGRSERHVWQDHFTPDRLFKRLSTLQRSVGMVSDEKARVAVVQDWRRRFRAFSQLAHGGSDMVRWTWSQEISGKCGTESCGVGDPGEGLPIIVPELLYLLHNFCSLFPLVIRPTRTPEPEVFPDEVKDYPEAHFREFTLMAGLYAVQAVVDELWVTLYPEDEFDGGA